MEGKETPKKRNQTLSKNVRNQMWQQFGEAVTEFIPTNEGIASMNDVFQIAAGIFPNLIWSTPRLEELAKYLTKNNHCSRIDLHIDYDKPLSLYPGHHKMSSTTFFVLSNSESSNEDGEAMQISDINKAKRLLDSLVQNAIEEAKKKKTHPKTAKNNESNQAKETKLISETESTNAENMKRSCPLLVQYDYIPMRKIRGQILHDFVLDTFGTKPFCIDDLLDQMSFDLAAKIAGVSVAPSFLLAEPKFRHILLKCFPDRILDQIDFEEIREGLYHIITLHCCMKGLPLRFYSLFHCLSPNPHLTGKERFTDLYELVPQATIDLFKSIEFTYDLLDDVQFRNFYEHFRAIELIENIDPHSFLLWMKRYSFNRSYRSTPSIVGKAIAEKAIHEPYQFTFPFSYAEAEDYIAEHGINWVNSLHSITTIYKSAERLINDCKMDPQSGPIYEICENISEQNFKTNPELYINSLTASDFKFLEGLDKNVVFNYLSAMMNLTPQGLILNLPKPWNHILEIHKEITNIDKEDFLNNTVPQNYHMFLMNTYRDYSDFHHYLIAKRSIESKKFNENSESVELCTSDYLSRFNLTRVRFNLTHSLAELIQYLKIILLTPSEFYIPSRGKQILAEIDNKQIEEAVLYLKLSKFMNQKIDLADKDKKIITFKVNRKLISDFNLSRPFSLYQNIIKYFNLAKDPSKVKSAAESNSGAVAYLVDPDSLLSLSLDVIHQTDSKSDNADKTDDFYNSNLFDAMTPLFKISKTSITKSSKNLKFNQDLVINPKLIGLPELPQFEVNDIQYHYLTTDSIFCDFRFYASDNNSELYDAFMRIFVLLYQLKSEKELNSLAIITRFIYSYVMNFFNDGVSLSDIISHFSNLSLNLLFEALSFLEHYEFILRLNIDSVMPHFISDVYAQPHYFKEKVEEGKYKLVKPHLWILEDGSIDIQMLQKCQMKLAEVIDNSPGIEFLEITDKMPQFTLNDIYQLLDVLEYDEIIYSVMKNDEESDLFDENNEMSSGFSFPLPHADSVSFLYCLAMHMMDPTQKRMKKYFYPTQRNNFNLALTSLI